MNKITVYGRLSQDVEVRDVGGSRCASFNVASRNKHKEKDTGEYGTNFYRVTAWGTSADAASRYLKKGHRVALTGDLIIRNYTGSDGAQRTSVEINNAEFDLVETRAEAGTAAAAPAPAPAPAPAGFTPVEADDDLPF